MIVTWPEELLVLSPIHPANEDCYGTSNSWLIAGGWVEDTNSQGDTKVEGVLANMEDLTKYR